MNDNSTPYHAADYDCDVVKTIPFYHQLHTETIDLVRTVRPGVTVWLDTGCGTGYLVEQALPVFPGTRFFLADPSAGMLERAGARLSGFPTERLHFLAPLRSEELVGAVGKTPQVISATYSPTITVVKMRAAGLPASAISFLSPEEYMLPSKTSGRPRSKGSRQPLSVGLVSRGQQADLRRRWRSIASGSTKIIFR